MTTTTPTRCDYGVCARRAVRIVEAGTDRRGACAAHASRMTTERDTTTPTPTVTAVPVTADRVTVAQQNEAGEVVAVTVMNSTAVAAFIAAVVTPGQTVTVLPCRPTTTTVSATGAIR